MPYCPKCRVEYVEGIAKCSDCEVDLVDELPPAPDDEADEEMDVLAEDRGAVETRMIAAELEAADIPYVLAGDELGAVMMYPAQDAKILVPHHLLERAREIMATVEKPDAELPDDAEVGPPVCDQCGAKLPAGATKCPVCQAPQDEPAPAAAPAGDEQIEIFFCDHCGAEAPRDAKKCPECGEPFDNP